MQSESVQLRILLSWSDELTIYTLHHAFHVACAWPNSKYEDINEILYRPSIVPGGGVEQVWGGSSPPPIKPPLSCTDFRNALDIHIKKQLVAYNTEGKNSGL